MSRISPRPPFSRQSSAITSIGSRVAGGPNTPINTVASNVSTPGTVFNSTSVGLTSYQVSGAFSGTLTLNCPAVAVNKSVQVTGKISLVTFPSPFTLVAGTNGMVQVSSSLSPNSVLPAGAHIGNVSSTFLYGANSTPTTGPLVAGLTYTQPAVSVTLTVANLGSKSIAAFSFVFVVQATLLGAVISAQAAVVPI